MLIVKKRWMEILVRLLGRELGRLVRIKNTSLLENQNMLFWVTPVFGNIHVHYPVHCTMMLLLFRKYMKTSEAKICSLIHFAS